MTKHKIKGIKPFNGCHFKSCYYHQLIAGISCFGIDKDDIIFNFFPVIKESFVIENTDIADEKQLAKILGYKNTRTNVGKKKLIKCIDAKMPVIVGVDSYYLQSRADTYLKEHSPHFLLVYGYDDNKNQADVIDHNYKNSYEYVEKTISLDNLFFANKMFRTGVFKRKLSCYILEKRINTSPSRVYNSMMAERVANNRSVSYKNLELLKCLCVNDLDYVKENVTLIAQYLQDLKSFYFGISKTDYFNKSDEKQIKISQLVSGYSNLLSLFWKIRAQNNYDYVTQKLEAILRKINDVELTEKSVYDYLSEMSK